MSIKITIINDGKVPLLCQYPQECQPQKAYLYFKPSSEVLELIADYTSEVGNNAMSQDVFYGKELRFSVTPFATRASIEALANDTDLEKTLIEIRGAYKEVYNNGHYEGRYNGLDEGFSSSVEYYLQGVLSQSEAWDAGEWLDSSISIKELVDKYSVENYANYLQAIADEQNIVLLGDIGSHIADYAMNEIERYIRKNSIDNTEIRKACDLLKEFNEDEYGYLLEDYIKEFENNIE